MIKKYIPAILTIIAIFIATLFWEKIILIYDVQNEIVGEYSKNNYNPKNDVLRFIFFITFPLIVFIISYLSLASKNTFSIKQVIFDKGEEIINKNKNSKYSFFLILFIFFFINRVFKYRFL